MGGHGCSSCLKAIGFLTEMSEGRRGLSLFGCRRSTTKLPPHLTTKPKGAAPISIIFIMEAEKMNAKKKNVALVLLVFAVVIEMCCIVLMTMFPDPGARKYLLKNPGQAPYMKMNPASFSLMTLMVSQRDGSTSSLVKYLRERFSENADLMEYLDWLEGNLEKGKCETMEELSQLKSHLDQGGKLYEYSYEKGADSEYGLLVIKDGKDIFRMPFVKNNH